MVELIRWRDSFSLGVASVDHEHRQLISLINELYNAMLSDSSPGTVMEFLGGLYAQIAAHFALEERLMREWAYAGYPSHKADHERLLDDIRDLMDDFEAGRHLDMEGFAARLEDWFTGHFRTEDAKLHAVLG